MLDIVNNIKGINDHVIYYEWYLDERAGGPTGYLANLLYGLNRIENLNSPFIVFDVREKGGTSIPAMHLKIYELLQKKIYGNRFTKYLMMNYLSKSKKKEHENYVKFIENPDYIYCDEIMFNRIDLDKTKTIHVHTVGDAVKIRNSLNRVHNTEIKVILTCHTPEAPSDEYYKEYIERGYSKKKAKVIRDGWRVIEKRAFCEADILVFPSVESMEPLKQTIPNFERIIEGKDIRFMETGAKTLHPTISVEEAKRKYGVEGKKVIGYIGRHNKIKGYDILKTAGKKLLSSNKNICFLIGGAIGSECKPLRNKRWIEAGWVNPADMLQAVDIFVLPNKMTYYDLVLIEVMSMGIPIVASKTGGNISVKELTDAIYLYNNSPEDMVDRIKEICDMDMKEYVDWKDKVKKAYDTYFTPVSFAERYKKMITEIYKDYNLFDAES